MTDFRGLNMVDEYARQMAEGPFLEGPAQTSGPIRDGQHRHDMYESAYHRVNAVLDRALGPDEKDGAGEGIAGDVALLAQRYLDLKRAALTNRGADLSRTIEDIESRELRDEWWED